MTDELIVTLTLTCRELLESKGFRLSRSKTDYSECGFTNSQSASVGRMTLQHQALPRIEHLSILVL